MAFISQKDFVVGSIKGLCQGSRQKKKKERIEAGNRRESIVNPQQDMKSKNYKIPRESLAASKLGFTQILLESIRALPAAEPSQEMQILILVTVRF